VTLLAAYSFDEAGNTVKDYANANDFSIATSDLHRTASGHTNGGLNSSGSIQATMADIGETANRTVMAWVYAFESISSAWVIQWYSSAIDSGAWGILSLSGSVHIQARNSSTLARASLTLSGNVSTNAWHHFAGTYDGTNVRLYVDGVLKATTALAGPLRTDTVPMLGGWTSTTPIIDDLRIYDNTLDATAITTAMNTPVVAATAGARIWNGSSWVSNNTKTYNGSSWNNSGVLRVF